MNRPKRWRVKEHGDDLITYWKSKPPHSNEYAAAEIIEELERELAEAQFRPMGDNHHNALACPYCRANASAPSAAPSGDKRGEWIECAANLFRLIVQNEAIGEPSWGDIEPRIRELMAARSSLSAERDTLGGVESEREDWDGALALLAECSNAPYIPVQAKQKIDAFLGRITREAQSSARRSNFSDPHLNRGWETDTSENGAKCHSIVIGGILCRWWGDEEPPGVSLLNAAASATQACPKCGASPRPGAPVLKDASP
jgi:hypothetical protein